MYIMYLNCSFLFADATIRARVQSAETRTSQEIDDQRQVGVVSSRTSGRWVMVIIRTSIHLILDKDMLLICIFIYL